MFKKILFALGISVAASVSSAHGPRHGHQHQHQGHWVAPLIISGVAAYALTRPQYPVPIQPYHPGYSPPIVLQHNQRVVCNRVYQVYSSSRGPYTSYDDCWIYQY